MMRTVDGICAEDYVMIGKDDVMDGRDDDMQRMTV